MKKMLLATALALLKACGYAQQTFTVEQTGSSSTEKPSPIISSFLGGQKKTSMQPKFVAAQKMLLKQKPHKHSSNGSLGFNFRHLYSAGSAVCVLTIIA